MGTNGPANDRINNDIQYWENLWPHWNSNPTKFGITAAMVNSVKNAVGGARNAYDGAVTARAAAKQATVAQREAIHDMKALGSPVVGIIKAFIENSGDPSLWADAGLTPPSPRGAVPPPTAPFDLSATVDSQGNIVIKWKSRQPSGASGTVYSIYRGLDGETATLLDTVGGKTFTDDAVPTGTRSVVYSIKAKRSNKSSPFSANLLLQFGRAVGGVPQIKSIKLAA